MASFDLALESLLTHEGGYANHPSDPGGPTKFGICQREFPDVDIAALTRDQAAYIYKQFYWRFDLVQNQAVANKLLDLSVNLGLHTTVRLTQQALGSLGAPLVIDGLLGPHTLECLNSTPAEMFLFRLRLRAERHYRDIAESNPPLAVFLDGWLKRLAT